MNDFPISPEFLQKRMMIPVKLAELSYVDEEVAIKYLRIWGEKRMPVTELFEKLNEELKNKKVNEGECE